MKKVMFILFTISLLLIGSTDAMASMSSSRVRKEARFMTDKMAYELGLSTRQSNDVYEINYDFMYAIRYIVDDIERGYEWAMNDYYEALDIRNDDLRWVLSNNQYRRFMGQDYFFRPIYVNRGKWNFRIYINYTNTNHFYYAKPYHYSSYCGANYRKHNNRPSYYNGKHNHPHYNGGTSVRNDKVYHSNRRSDFGSVSFRPNSSTRPSQNTKPSNNNNHSTNRPSNNNNSSHSSNRPSNNNSSNTNRPSNNKDKESSTNRPSNNSSHSSSRPSGNSSNSNSSNRPANKKDKESTTSKPSNSSSNSSSRRSNTSNSSSSSSSSRTTTRSSSSSKNEKENKKSSTRTSKTSTDENKSSSRR